MPSDKKDGEQDGTQASQALYGWWLNLLPNMLGAALPKGTTAAAAPFPADQVSEALQATQRLLEPLFQGYLKALSLNTEPGQAFGEWQASMQAQLKALADGLAGIGKGLTMAVPDGASASAWQLMGEQPMALFGQALKPMSTNLERAYGGLADAFGLAPSRDLLGAARDMASATLARQRAQAEYLALVVTALVKGSEQLMSRLQAMGEKGESIDSLLGLVRLWARTADEAMHSAMQTPPALQASARLVRAGTRARQQQQRIVALASEALNVPTRAEVDEAYREIQALKRELRQLRKSIVAPVTAPAPAIALNGASSSQRPARKRTTAAQRKTPSKAAAS